MIVDLFANSNKATFNSYIASKHGLELAIYLEQLFDAYSNAKNLKDGWVTLHRKDIEKKTTLTHAKQLDIDEQLESMCVLKRNKDSADSIKLDINAVISLFSDDNLKVVDMANKLKTELSKTLTKKEKKEKAIANNLKAYVTTDNDELRQAYYTWIDVMAESIEKQPLNKAAVIEGQKVVDKYANHDLDLALRVINYAAICEYRLMDWAINKIEGDSQTSTNKNTYKKAQIPASPSKPIAPPKPLEYGEVF